MVDAPPCQVSPSGYAALGGRSCASLSWMRGFRATTWRGGRAACLEGPKNEGRKDMEPTPPPSGPLGLGPGGPCWRGSICALVGHFGLKRPPPCSS